jgi:hypothetical protein
VTIQTLAPGEKDIFKIVQTIIQLCQGRNNATGTVTLAASATTTVIPAVNCAAGTTPILTPLTAHAAAELAAGGCYVSTVANGSFTISHSSSSQTDRTFLFATLG